MAQAKLQIEVISADNLYNADGMLAGKSDPYVIVEVPGQPTMKFQTPVINNCLAPVWNHVGEIDGFMDGDTLEFQVWDKDSWPKPDQLLGKAMLTAQDFYPNGLEGPLILSESKTEASLTVRVLVLDTTDPSQDPNMVGQEGMVDPYQQMEYQQPIAEGGVMEGGMVPQVPGPQTLHVNVMNARGLYNADGFLAGKSDPYCVCLVPEKKNLKFHTNTINNCLDPDWNHTGLIHGFEAGDSLEFQVWDADTKPKPDQLLGTVTLTPQDFANNPDGIAGVLQLGGGLSKDQGTLEVKIMVDVGATMDDAAEAAAHEAQAQAHGHGSSAQAAAGHAAQPQPGLQRPSVGSQNVDKLAGAKMAKLKVTVFGASGLYNADGFLAGKSDPYVICQVPENKKVQKFKTKVLSNTLEPTWNHLGVINSFIVGHTLELEVYDSDTPPKPDQLLGKVVLNSDEFFPQGLEGALLLDESKAEGATLSVRIEVLPDTAATGLTGAKISTGGYYNPGTTTTYQTGQVRPSYQMQSGSGVYYQQQPYATTGSVQYVTGGVPGATMAGSVTGAPTYTYTTQAPATTVVQQAVAQAAFDAMDSNHDGVITRSEFARVAAEPIASPAAQPVATKVEYASSPVTYTTAQAPMQPATYSAPTTYAAAAPATTYAAAAPATTYAAAAPATTYAAPATTYATAAPTTYTVAAPTAPAAEFSATKVSMPATTVMQPAAPTVMQQAPAPVTPASCTFAAGSAAPAYTAPTTAFTAPVASYTVSPGQVAAPSPVTYMKPAPATTIMAGPAVTKPAMPATTVAPAQPVTIPASRIVSSAPTISSQPMTYSTAQPVAQPMTQTYAQPMPAQQVTTAAPITIASAPTAAATVAAPRLSMAMGSPTTTMGNTARVTYAAAPAAMYTMGPQVATMAPAATAGQSLFDRLDRNHDGVVSRSEFNSALR